MWIFQREYHKAYYYQTDDIIKGENNVKSIPVYCEGRKFANARECAEYYNVNVYTMKNWINRINKMPKEWYERGLRQETKTMDDYAECFDGVPVDNKTRIELCKSHIRFCENALKQLD